MSSDLYSHSLSFSFTQKLCYNDCQKQSKISLLSGVSKIGNQILSYPILICANVGFFEVSFRIAKLVYALFPANENISQSLKIFKDLSVFATSIVVYTTANIGLCSVCELPISVLIHGTISSVIFTVLIFLKFPRPKVSTTM